MRPIHAEGVVYVAVPARAATKELRTDHRERKPAKVPPLDRIRRDCRTDEQRRCSLGLTHIYASVPGVLDTARASCCHDHDCPPRCSASWSKRRALSAWTFVGLRRAVGSWK